MTPTARSLKHLRQLGCVADVVERWLPRVNRRRDLFGCIDIVAVHPLHRVVLGVQATTIGNLAARLTKAKSKPQLRAWLRAGCFFECWGWELRGERWQVKRVKIRAEDLETIVVTCPPRRRARKGERQRELFD